MSFDRERPIYCDPASLKSIFLLIDRGGGADSLNRYRKLSLVKHKVWLYIRFGPEHTVLYLLLINLMQQTCLLSRYHGEMIRESIVFPAAPSMVHDTALLPSTSFPQW